MKEHDEVDLLILKAADVMEKQGQMKHSLGKPNGPLCIQGSLLVAQGATITEDGTWSTYQHNPLGFKAEERLNSKMKGDICGFNNEYDKDHVVASMRAIANKEPLPAEPVPA